MKSWGSRGRVVRRSKPPSIEHYLPAAHSIESRPDETTLHELADLAFGQQFVGAAPMVFVIAGIIGRTEVEYGAVSGLLTNREAGHVAQNMLLQATALELAAVPIGGFDAAAVSRALALAPGEEVLHLMPVGHPIVEPGARVSPIRTRASPFTSATTATSSRRSHLNGPKPLGRRGSDRNPGIGYLWQSPRGGRVGVQPTPHPAQPLQPRSRSPE